MQCLLTDLPWLTDLPPVIFIQVQENLLLLCSDSWPTSVNSISPDISLPLLRYHYENIHHAHYSKPHCSLKKYLGDNSEKWSLKIQCSLIHDRMTTGFSQVHCTSEETAVSGLTHTTLFDSCSTDFWEFLSELPKCWPCQIHSLKKILH